MVSTLVTILDTIAFSFCTLSILLMLAGIFTGNKTFTRHFALAFDMFWNVLSGGGIDITISSRAGIAATQNKRWGTVLSKALGFLEKDHCTLAIESDIDRAKAVIATLTPYDPRTKN